MIPNKQNKIHTSFVFKKSSYKPNLFTYLEDDKIKDKLNTYEFI